MAEPMRDGPFAVLHVPHSSRVVPAETRSAIVLSDGALSKELLLMTDAFTDELFRFDPRTARAIVFPVSRLVVDPERFLDDALEPMSERGMGVVYTKTSDGGRLRERPSHEERLALVNAYYEPHRRRLEEAVNAALHRWGWCLVVDCHSFPSVPLPYEPDQSPERPEICLGTDPFHTPAGLVSAAVDSFREAGLRIALNRPFSGALVPGAHYRQDSRVLGIMVEVNRSLYMDETSGERLPAFEPFAAALRSAVVCVIEAALQLVNARA